MVDILAYGLVLLVFLNVLAFFAYYRDKAAAQKGTWRTPESRLLVLALFGPFGAFAAMRAFRHKTQKAKFWLVSLFLCLQVVLIAAFILAFVGL
mgnify:CR=1 FL=1|jgi:uncharacterized membrane protein YsdA (DUF1294 family)